MYPRVNKLNYTEFAISNYFIFIYLVSYIYIYLFLFQCSVLCFQRTSFLIYSNFGQRPAVFAVNVGWPDYLF